MLLFIKIFLVPSTHPIGKHSVEVILTYQACDNRICLPPQQIKQTYQYTILDKPPREQYLLSNRQIDTAQILPEEYSKIIQGGLGTFTLIAILAALAALATPCVFPMIPITVTFFSNQSTKKNSHSFLLSLLFLLGIVVTYTSVGLGISLLFGVSGISKFVTNPFVNIVIGCVFILFALSFFGFFRFAFPSKLMVKLHNMSQSLGIFGVFIIGISFSLTAFTCTFQFIGTVLIAAAYGEFFYPLWGMLVFSTVFGAPFFILSLLPSKFSQFQKNIQHGYPKAFSL